nr:hypothetical protein CFP56_06668 [Quercus suber]
MAQTNQVFQAQLDAIDEDLARYDTVEEGGGCDLKVQSGGVGSKVVGSAKFLKNLFTQTEPCRNILRNSKPSQVVRTSTFEPVVGCSAKCMRSDLEEVWTEGFDCKKKRVIFSDNPMVEAAEQPR